MTTAQLIVANRVARLQRLGVVGYIAEAIADEVDLDKVEALVLARNCPVELAIRIARY